MPNVTIFIHADRMPPDEALTDLTEQCTQLCTDILHAALANVHVIYVAVRHGRGHPVFADIQYRLEPFRTHRSWIGSWRDWTTLSGTASPSPRASAASAMQRQTLMRALEGRRRQR